MHAPPNVPGGLGPDGVGPGVGDGVGDGFFPGDTLPGGNMHLPRALPAAPNLTHCKPGAQF